MSIRIGSTIAPALVAVKLCSNHRVVCASQEYLQKNGTPKTLKDLGARNCLTFNQQGGQQRWAFQGKQPYPHRTHFRQSGLQ